MQPQANSAESVAHVLMKEILPLKDQKWLDGNRIRAIVERFQIAEIEAQIYFLRELQTLVRNLPLKIYSDGESRLRLIGAIQDAVDLAIEEEDA